MVSEKTNEEHLTNSIKSTIKKLNLKIVYIIIRLNY